MTPDTCPHCGAPGCVTFACGSEWEEGKLVQSPECARYVRVRISQLRRMAEQAFRVWDRLPPGKKTIRHAQQLDHFRCACLREIDRLRGGA
jgi:hypothetical protein